MIEPDRPIKPDQKYLEEYLQRINKVEVKPFLKKHSHQQLPCNAHKEMPRETSSQVNDERGRKTKAELYEEIKQKNREKFGDRTSKTIVVEQKPKRLNPKKMTVEYKPKPIIDTAEYKKKDYTPSLKPISPPSQNKDKIEYQKLIDYFNREMKQLQQEKEEFGRVAEKLKFKQMISSEEGLLYSQAKGQVQREMAQRKMLSTQPPQQQVEKDHIQTTNQSRQVITKPPQPKDRLIKTFSAGDIRLKLDKTCEQLQLLKNQMLHQTLEVQEHRYEIFQAHLLPNFTPQSLYDFIDTATLKYNGNSLYKTAMKAFNSQFGKENKPANAEEIQQDKQGIREKMMGEKRVRKYEGWTEVWTPGKQRLMANSQGYRVVWLANGDVIQEFSNEIKAYFSKAKEILKIEFKTFPPVYYHSGLKQLWKYLPDGSREIVFENGRLQTVLQEHR